MVDTIFTISQPQLKKGADRTLTFMSGCCRLFRNSACWRLTIAEGGPAGTRTRNHWSSSKVSAFDPLLPNPRLLDQLAPLLHILPHHRTERFRRARDGFDADANVF